MALFFLSCNKVRMLLKQTAKRICSGRLRPPLFKRSSKHDQPNISNQSRPIWAAFFIYPSVFEDFNDSSVLVLLPCSCAWCRKCPSRKGFRRYKAVT